MDEKTKELVECISALIKMSAVDGVDSVKALQWTQAALNAAHASEVLRYQGVLG